MKGLTSKEREAIEAFRKLAETWPPTLTLHVATSSEKVNIIRTPEPGKPGFEDLGDAETFATVRIPVASSA